MSEYNLVPPLVSTDVGEIGNWTIGGTTTNIKKAVRLTSAIPSSFGSICQRVPTLFKEWKLQFELKASNPNKKEMPGNCIWFFYTEDVCPNFGITFKGFTLWINTTSTNSEGLSDIYFLKGNGTTTSIDGLKPVGKVRVRDEKTPLRVEISKNANSLTIDVFEKYEPKRIVDEDIIGLPEYGYFSFSALTSERVDNNDIVSFRVFNNSAIDHPNRTIDFATDNKIIIDMAKKTRRLKKAERFSAMKKVLQYYDECKNEGKKLNAQEELDLREAIRIIDEAFVRSHNTLTKDDLEQFLSQQVDSTVEKAHQKIELAQSKYSETKRDIDDLWANLKQQLIGMALEEKEMMMELKKDVLNYAKRLNLKDIDIENSEKKLNTETDHLSESQITNILLLICIVEFVVYVIFFLVMRKKTNNFKKRD